MRWFYLYSITMVRKFLILLILTSFVIHGLISAAQAALSEEAHDFVACEIAGVFCAEHDNHGTPSANHSDTHETLILSLIQLILSFTILIFFVLRLDTLRTFLKTSVVYPIQSISDPPILIGNLSAIRE